MKKLIVLGVFFSLLVLGVPSVSADVKAILKLKKRNSLNSAGTYFMPKRIKASSDDSITENTQIIKAKSNNRFSVDDENITDSEITVAFNPLGLSSPVNPKVSSLGVTFSSKITNVKIRAKFQVKNLKKLSVDNGFIYSGIFIDGVAKGRFRIKVDDL